MVRVVAAPWVGVESQRPRGGNLMTEVVATSAKCLREARRMVGREELNPVVFS